MTQKDNLDEIDSFLLKEFGIMAGCCASQKAFEYSVARRVAEKLWKQEQPASEELEEAAENHALKCHSKKASVATLAASIYDFRAGADWRKEQMMKNGVDAIVYKIGRNYLKEIDRDAILKALTNYKDGDKVKVIIVKEAEK